MRGILLRSIGVLVACPWLLVGNAANAAPISVFLQDVTVGSAIYSLGGDSDFSYDPSTGILSSTGTWTGTASVGNAGGSLLYTHSIMNFGLSNTLAPSATNYGCFEGDFGATVGADLCGGYEFGPNGLDNSTYNTNGTDRVIDGDDIVTGPQQSLADYTMDTRSWDGINLVYNGSQTGSLLTMTFGTLPGATQQNPVLPVGGPPWVFNEVTTDGWVDPPLTDAFIYSMTSASLFTDILDFPTGFDDLFCVSANSQNLGCFGAGDSVDFIALLGFGVSEFTIFNIGPTVDVEDPQAFPLQLAFDTPTASFIMTAAVPVPAAVWLFGSALGLLGWMRRKAT